MNDGIFRNADMPTQDAFTERVVRLRSSLKGGVKKVLLVSRAWGNGVFRQESK
jgi:hypothetical protein